MLTPEERFEVGLKALERLKPQMRALRRRRMAARLDRRAEPTGRFDSQSSQIPGANPGWAQTSSRDGRMAEARSLPCGTLFLGACEDGLPFTVDLYDPRPGSLLITGDNGSGKARLLRTLLASAGALNNAGQIAVHLISPDPDSLLSFGPAGQFRLVLTPDDPAGRGLLEGLEALMETRREDGEPEGTVVILAIDDLGSWLEHLDSDSFRRLRRLTIHGPRERVWVVATLPAGRVDDLDARILDGFRTRLIGHILAPGLATYLAEDPESGAESLEPGEQFTVAYNREWLRFRLCQADSPAYEF